MGGKNKAQQKPVDFRQRNRKKGAWKERKHLENTCSTLAKQHRETCSLNQHPLQKRPTGELDIHLLQDVVKCSHPLMHRVVSEIAKESGYSTLLGSGKECKGINNEKKKHNRKPHQRGGKKEDDEIERQGKAESSSHKHTKEAITTNTINP